MKMYDFYALAVVAFLMTCTLMVAVSCAPRHQDYWGSLAQGVGTVEKRP